MKKLLFLLVFIPLVSFGQDYENSNDAKELCTLVKGNNSTSNSEAKDANYEDGLNTILSVIGASKRFVMHPCSNIDNAIALSSKGIRYILYDRGFMNSLSNRNDWGNLFILAHEVGHHINGHSLDLALYEEEIIQPETLSNRRQLELEADEFAAFILAKLGVALDEITAIISLKSSEGDDTYSTHPNRNRRLSAVNTGFNKAVVGINADKSHYAATTIQQAEEYFYSAYEKAKNGDHYGAIADYTKAIELDPNNAADYINRAVSKQKLNDNNGAISDYNKAIELKYDFDYAYRNRGVAKHFTGLNGCPDLMRAKELGYNVYPLSIILCATKP